MKKITLPLVAFFLLFKFTYGQVMENSHIISVNNSQEEASQNTFISQNDTNQLYIDSNEDILTISLVDTNYQNTPSNSTNADISEFIELSNNGSDLTFSDSSVEVNLSSDITTGLTTNVSYTTLRRIWKVVETIEGTPTVNVKIPRELIITSNVPGRY